MWTVAFWKDAGERASRTGAQFVVYVLFVGDTGPVNAFDVDWRLVLGAAVMGAFLSLLFSLGATQVGQRGTASLVPEVEYEPKSPDNGATGPRHLAT